jgi:hypothetical protein
MKGVLVLATVLSGPGISVSAAQTSVPPMPALQAASPLQTRLSNAGVPLNASPNLALGNSTACSPPNQNMTTLPTFDGGGLNLGGMGTQSSTLPQAGTARSIVAAASPSAPCGATTSTSETSAGTATASSADTSSLGTAGLGTSGLGTVGLGTAGPASSSVGSATTSQPATTLPLGTGSATGCATNSSGMPGGSGTNAADQIGQGASGTVTEPAESLANTIPSPAQTLSGSANLPELSPSCANTP